MNPTKHHPMRRGPAAVGACLGCALLQVSFASTLPELTSLLKGEYNNHEQVWQQGLDGAVTSPRRHWKWALVADNTLSLATSEGQSAASPEWIFSFEQIGDVTHSRARPLNESGPVCHYNWTKQGSGFEATLTEASNCAELLPSRWQIDGDLLTVTATAITEATPFRARRVTYYKGWIALAKTAIDESAGEDDYVFLSGIQAHDEGTMTSILDEGQPTGYAVELARLTYQNTKVAVLKLGIIDETTGKTLAYAWANPGAELVGINLRWVQCGFTRDRD